MAGNAARSAETDDKDGAYGSMDDILRSIRDILGDDMAEPSSEPRFPAPAQTANHVDNARAAEPAEKPKRDTPLAFLQRRRDRNEHRGEPAPAPNAPRPTLEERLARHRQKAEAEREALRRLTDREVGGATSDAATGDRVTAAQEPDEAFFADDAPRPKLALPDLEPEVIDYTGTAKAPPAEAAEPPVGHVPESAFEPATVAAGSEMSTAAPAVDAEPVPSALAPAPATIAPLDEALAEPVDPLEAAIEELAAVEMEPVLRGTIDRSTRDDASGDTTTADRSVEVIAAPSRPADAAEELRALMAERPEAFSAALTDLMRPLVAEWLDDNLPSVVERVVREEIERVSRGPR